MYLIQNMPFFDCPMIFAFIGELAGQQLGKTGLGGGSLFGQKQQIPEWLAFVQVDGNSDKPCGTQVNNRPSQNADKHLRNDRQFLKVTSEYPSYSGNDECRD